LSGSTPASSGYREPIPVDRVVAPPGAGGQTSPIAAFFERVFGTAAPAPAALPYGTSASSPVVPGKPADPTGTPEQLYGSAAPPGSWPNPGAQAGPVASLADPNLLFTEVPLFGEFAYVPDPQVFG
jgi:hypothetical protein